MSREQPAETRIVSSKIPRPTQAVERIGQGRAVGVAGDVVVGVVLGPAGGGERGERDGDDECETTGERSLDTGADCCSPRDDEHGRETDAREVNAALKAAAEGKLTGILGYEERPLVSADYVNDTRSAIVDAPSTMVVNGTQVKIYAWYDNEMGYAHRLVDVALMVGGTL